MDENVKKEYEAKAQKVRTDLKQWEADWAKTHDGKKPGRDDIKNNPVIGTSYKLNNHSAQAKTANAKKPKSTKSTTSSATS